MQFIYSFAPSFGALLASPGYAIFIICIFFLIRFLKLTSFDEKPQITLMRSKRGGNEKKKLRRLSADGNDNLPLDLAEIIDQCTILNENYIPPPIWGRNGHIQTAVYGILGHQSLRRTFDKRHFLSLPDGTTATFDVFEPISAHQNGGDFTLVFCPGIANCSESNYIRTCVHLIQENGYRSAVLNHLGVLRDAKLTSERIFSYGGNGEMEEMFKKLAELYPRTRFIAIGYSMGANVLTNCMARLESVEIRSRIILAISICQGYSATIASQLLMEWESGRRIYNYIITENVKRLLRRNFEKAVKPHVKNGLVDEKQLWSATSLIWLDEWYSRRVHGFDSLKAYYENSSCLPRIKDIKVPMIFLNALDDPLVPQQLWEPVREICQTHPRHAFILLKHGGHLGFLEGSTPFNPRSITWLDRLILQLAEAVTAAGQTHDDHPTSSSKSTAASF